MRQPVGYKVPMTYDARAIANVLLDFADEKKIELTLMALLKIIYYAHGWHLAHRKEALIKQGVEAWDYGPVVRVVYDAFKGNGRAPLTTRAKRFDVLTHAHIEIDDPIEPDIRKFLKNIFDAYVHVDAFDLSNWTHAHGSPWDEVWNVGNGAINIGMKIPNDQIRKWFSEKRAPGFLH
jgi:uncharacterized phage-associated protein